MSWAAGASLRRAKHTLLLLALLVSPLAHTHGGRAELPEGERAALAKPAKPPLLLRLAPTAEQRESARAAALERRLVRLISALPDVERAEVSVDLPLPSDQPLDQPAGPAHVTAVITLGRAQAPRQTRDAIEPIVSAVLPGLDLHQLTVIERARAPDAAARPAPTSAHSLVQIGPFRVHAQSATALRTGLAVLLATNALLATLLLWRTRLARARSARRTES